MRRPRDPLLAGLVDDAALFPPGNAPMAGGAAPSTREHRTRLVRRRRPVPVPRGPRSTSCAAPLPADQAVAVSLVVDVTVDRRRRRAARPLTPTTASSLVGIEAALAGSATTRRRRRRPAAAARRHRLGLPRGPARRGFDAALDLVGDGRLAARRSTAPAASTRRRVPDRAPSWPHFLVALRGARSCRSSSPPGCTTPSGTTDARTGFEQHGVLNVLVATRVAQARRRPRRRSRTSLAERDADPLVERVRSWSEADAHGVRGRVPVVRLLRGRPSRSASCARSACSSEEASA